MSCISHCACGVPCPLPPCRPSMKPSIAPPAPFDETIDRGSDPTCSLCPRWRPSMIPSIAPPVLCDETIDRAVVLHHYYTYLLSFAEADGCCCCMYISPRLFILSIHLEQAMAETTKKNHRRARPLIGRGGRSKGLVSAPCSETGQI